MNTFETTFLIFVGTFTALIWTAVYADTVGPGLVRIAQKTGRKIARKFHPRRSKP